MCSPPGDIQCRVYFPFGHIFQVEGVIFCSKNLNFTSLAKILANKIWTFVNPLRVLPISSYGTNKNQ